MEARADSKEYKEYLYSLRPGDKIVHTERYDFGRTIRLDTLIVVRRTPTQIVCNLRGQEVRYRADTGRRIGNIYGMLPVRADEATIAQVTADIQHHKHARVLREFDWHKADHAVVSAAYAAIAKEMEKCSAPQK